MAEMIPPYLKSDADYLKEGKDPPPQSERTFFGLLKKYLDDDYVVIHGEAWQSKRQTGGIDDREIDFLIAHPIHGILVVEVKGGILQYDTAKRQWNRRVGRRWQWAKDPVAQVKRASYDLHDRIQNTPELSKFNFSTWYAVALVDVDVPGTGIAGMPKDMFIDRRDLAHLGTKIEAVYKHYQRQGQQSPYKKGIRALKHKLVPNTVLRTYLATDFEHEEEQFKELTEQQYLVLEGLGHKNRALIAGCAGSGKTMLALEKARQLTNEGKRVLFTCYNKRLAHWLHHEVWPRTPEAVHENLVIQHFHGLAFEVCKQTGHSIPQKKPTETHETYFGTVVPEKLFEASDRLSEEQRFDAIIVDEGQDFRSTYWAAIQALLKEPDDGILYIFFDDSQRLYSNDNFPLPETSFRLNRNLRSTYEVGLKVCDYYQGKGEIIPGGPKSGREISYVDLSKYDHEITALDKVVAHLRSEQIPLDDIVVLTPLSDASILRHEMSIGQVVIGRGEKRSSRQLLVDSIFSFKGLERPVVVLAEIDKGSVEDRKSLLYVALSRARNHVIVLGKLPE